MAWTSSRRVAPAPPRISRRRRRPAQTSPSPMRHAPARHQRQAGRGGLLAAPEGLGHRGCLAAARRCRTAPAGTGLQHPPPTDLGHFHSNAPGACSGSSTSSDQNNGRAEACPELSEADPTNESATRLALGRAARLSHRWRLKGAQATFGACVMVPTLAKQRHQGFDQSGARRCKSPEQPHAPGRHLPR